jgi:hypothetical protein
MCDCAEVILSSDGEGKRDCLELVYDEGTGSFSSNYKPFVEANRLRFDKLKPGFQRIERKVIELMRGGRRVGSVNAVSATPAAAEIASYSDIIVDVSAIPRGIYFPLIGRLLTLIDNEIRPPTRPNLHVVVSENAEIDSNITTQGLEEKPNYLYGFTGPVDNEADSQRPRVWIPLLGEHNRQ